MSQRIRELLDRLDRDVYAITREGEKPTPEETVIMMMSLCYRACALGLGAALPEADIDKVAASLVDMILQIREEAEKRKKMS